MEEFGKAWSSAGHWCNVLRSIFDDLYVAGTLALQEPKHARNA